MQQPPLTAFVSNAGCPLVPLTLLQSMHHTFSYLPSSIPWVFLAYSHLSSHQLVAFLIAPGDAQNLDGAEGEIPYARGNDIVSSKVPMANAGAGAGMVHGRYYAWQAGSQNWTHPPRIPRITHPGSNLAQPW